MDMVSHMANHIEPLDRVFHALSDPTRRAIVMRLSESPAGVGELFDKPRMALPTLLKHIKVLEESGLVATRKVGRVRTCEIRKEALAMTEDWLARQRAVWEARLDRMEAYVTALHEQEKNSDKSR